jgi:hypothetical protein
MSGFKEETLDDVAVTLGDATGHEFHAEAEDGVGAGHR